MLDFFEDGHVDRVLMLDHLIHSYVVPDDPTLLDYGYEHGASSVIVLSWNDRQRELRFAARVGRFPGMLQTRRFVVHLVQAGCAPLLSSEGVSVVYEGRALAIRMPASSSSVPACPEPQQRDL